MVRQRAQPIVLQKAFELWAVGGRASNAGRSIFSGAISARTSAPHPPRTTGFKRNLCSSPALIPAQPLLDSTSKKALAYPFALQLLPPLSLIS
jgi:hypothetical protein